jgi:recombination protein RecT
MSTTTLKAAVTGQANAHAPAKTRPTTIAGLLADKAVKEQISLALPKHMTADRLARIALTEVRKTPQLATCDQASFLGAIMQCAQLGLEPGSALGHAYLLPFENRRKGITEVQFIVGYRGMLDLARRSGQILSLEARAVYAADKFHVSLGLNPDLTHEPDWEAADRGQLRFVYAVAKLKDGGTQFDVMSRADVDRVRAKSRAGNSGPWVDHFEEMAKKTVLRRLFKWLPISIELASAVEQDERVDLSMMQDNPLTIDQDTGEITGGRPADQPAPPATPSALILDRINDCKSLDVLDILSDDASDMDMTDTERAILMTAIEARAKALSDASK